MGCGVFYQSSSSCLGKSAPKPASAYDKDLEKAAAASFDRETGEPVPKQDLKSYQEALARYHLHPEAKFHNGDYPDYGVTVKRNLVAAAVDT